MKRNPRHAALAVVLFLLAGSALAGTTGTEFQALYTWTNDVVTGYFGRAVAVAAVAAAAGIIIFHCLPACLLQHQADLAGWSFLALLLAS